MHFWGVHHKAPHLQTTDLTDAPRMEKGRSVLASANVVSKNTKMACSCGWIANAPDLVRELDLYSPTPSEIVLAAYERWGDAYPEHLEGPISTAVADSEGDKLILSRDRMGDKPLFYVQMNGYTAFAGHPDILLKMGACRPVVDESGLNELFALGPARTPGRTFYRDIRQLEPGCMLIMHGDDAEYRRYYTLPIREHTDDKEKTVFTVRELLEAAISDIRGKYPAVMLSGGLDSTALTALLSSVQPQVMSFSVDYEDSERDFSKTDFQPEQDRAYIDMAVEAFGTRHRRIVLSQKSLADTLSEATDARGMPGMADVDSSFLLFARAVAEKSRYVVSGECADEVFGGYPWFQSADALRPDVFPWSGSVELRAKILKRSVREKLHPALYVRNTVREAIDKAAHPAGESGKEACLRTMQNLCFRFFMANLQERAGQICAWENLRVLTPFSDRRLVEYVYNVPWEMKFLNGENKGLLRAAVADLLPEKLLHRKKSPYPKTHSPEYTKIVRKMALRMLADKKAPIREWIDADEVEKIARSELLPSATPWFGQLMSGPQLLAYLLQVNDWMRTRGVEVIL